MKPQVVAVTFARGGSKGVPRKNIRPLGGKPLIAWSIETAKSCDLIDRVVVCTDDEEIADVARAYGAEVPFLRPAELAQDGSPEWLAWQHAIQELSRPDDAPPIGALVSVPATSPLRAVEDLNACIDLFFEGNCDEVITVTEGARNPYYNMVTLDADQSAELVIKPDKPIYARQEAPQVYDMTTVAYVTRPEYVMNNCSHFDGRVKAAVIPAERALDIDTILDFQFAEFLLQKGAGP